MIKHRHLAGEIQEALDRGPRPAVDTLIIVARDQDALGVLGKKIDHPPLELGKVLRLVDHKKLELRRFAALIETIEHIRVIGKPADAFKLGQPPRVAVELQPRYIVVLIHPHFPEIHAPDTSQVLREHEPVVLGLRGHGAVLKVHVGADLHTKVAAELLEMILRHHLPDAERELLERERVKRAKIRKVFIVQLELPHRAVHGFAGGFLREGEIANGPPWRPRGQGFFDFVQ